MNTTTAFFLRIFYGFVINIFFIYGYSFCHAKTFCADRDDIKRLAVDHVGISQFITNYSIDVEKIDSEELMEIYEVTISPNPSKFTSSPLEGLGGGFTVRIKKEKNECEVIRLVFEQ